MDWICDYLKNHPGTSIHGSLPCTVWSAWQYMAIQRHGPTYFEKLKRRRGQSIQLLKSFIKCAELCLSLGGEVSFEWPRDCSGWQRPELIKFIHCNSLHTASVDGCGCGMTNPAGEPLLKKWRFICSSKRLAAALSTLRCEHPSGFKHGEIVGSVTKSTESYPMRLCNKYLAALFGGEA